MLFATFLLRLGYHTSVYLPPPGDGDRVGVWRGVMHRLLFFPDLLEPGVPVSDCSEGAPTADSEWCTKPLGDRQGGTSLL